ncbi:MAG: hypothetical protein ACFFE8_04740 [Candidatus Heimdallarchaeota archaeon]
MVNQQNEEHNTPETLKDILSSLKTSAEVRPELKQFASSLHERLFNLTQDYYAGLIFLFTNPLTFHQRLILMQLIAIHPAGSSGIELARSLGISVQSKSVYRDLSTLQRLRLVRMKEIHSRLKLAFANTENRLVLRLVELVQLHGAELTKFLKKSNGSHE